MSRYIPIAHDLFEPKVAVLHPQGAKPIKSGKILHLKVQPIVSLDAVRLARAE